MNRERARELLPIIQAFADGKDIQFHNISADRWLDCADEGDVLFDRPPKFYRVKPEPLECWVNVYTEGNMFINTTEKNAKYRAGDDAIRIAVHMREVTE